MDRVRLIVGKSWARTRYWARIAWLLTLYGIDLAFDVAEGYAAIIRREAELFFGTALFLVGLLSFESSKYCDGNTADYLSCTRPATYYYFDWLDITLIVLGIFFLLFWHLKRNGHQS